MVFPSLWLNPDQTQTSTYDRGELAPLTVTKKADVAEHPKVFHHVGLLINEPPGGTGLPFK
jgi:hypothetical protein